MIAFVDVGYREEEAFAACVVLRDWTDEAPVEERVVTVSPIAAYEPGSFYKRELPCVLAVVAALEHAPDLVVVDGYVWLDDGGRRGLGAYVHDALQVPVAGVAKSPFRGSAHAVAVTRGQSDRPLFVTAVGADPTDIAERLAWMHGPYRLPTALRRVDDLSKGRG